jgi:predicted RNA-binding Zn ribbon-like protein
VDSTGRLLVDPAPGGLSVVQDLLNSAGMPAAAVPDLLADAAAAQAWLDAALRTWGGQTGRTPPRISVAESDLAALRDLRTRVRGWVTGAADERALPLDAAVSFGADGPTHAPRGDGAAAVTSLVVLEVLLAAAAGRLARLKTCRNPACGAAFYDLSRNSSRVWHDMRTCGNAINLRASRSRRRSSEPAWSRPRSGASSRTT